MVKYSCEPTVPEKACKAMGCDLRVHFKNTYEVAGAIRGMELQKAKDYLDAVLDHKRCIPYRVYNFHCGRTAQAKEFKLSQGRWPTKSIKYMINLLQNAEANAEHKQLKTQELVISHISVNRAIPGHRRTYRAHGRINAYMNHPCHIEIICQEKDETVEKAEDVLEKRFTKKQLAKRRLGAKN
jgi:large subunit ribosomal protein L17e